MQVHNRLPCTKLIWSTAHPLLHTIHPRAVHYFYILLIFNFYLFLTFFILSEHHYYISINLQTIRSRFSRLPAVTATLQRYSGQANIRLMDQINILPIALKSLVLFYRRSDWWKFWWQNSVKNHLYPPWMRLFVFIPSCLVSFADLFIFYLIDEYSCCVPHPGVKVLFLFLESSKRLLSSFWNAVG